MQYQESFRFKNGHSLGVTCMSFSPDRALLASGGIEGNICVWDMKSQKLLASSAPVAQKGVSVLSCAWKEGRNDSFVCGVQDGSIAEVTLTSSKLSILGIRAHNSPVEKLAVDGQCVVSAAQSQVRVWKTEADEKWIRISELDNPPSSADSMELVVTGLFFTKATASFHKSLLVAYMHHGLMLYDAQSYTAIKSIPYSGVIGNCDLHPDGNALAISNCKGSFEVYRLDTEKRYRFQPQHEQHRSLPSLFAHNGNALLTGSSIGKARLWDVSTRFIHKHLSTGGGTEILAIAACHHIQEEEKKDTFFIATGITSASVPCDIVIWAAKYVDRKKSAKVVNNVVQRSLSSLFLRFCQRLSQLVIFVAIALLADVLRRLYEATIHGATPPSE